MISAGDTYKTALRHSHESVITVAAYEGDTYLGDLNVVDATLTLDAKNDIQRVADIRVAVDPLRSEARDTLESISTTKGYVEISHGIKSGGGIIETVQLCRLRIDEIEKSGSKATRLLRCFDRTILLQDHLLVTARPLNDTYTNLITTLIQETLPGESVTIDSSIDTALTPADGKSFNRGDDRLRKIQELAEAVDAWLICDTGGAFHLVPGPGSDAAQAQAVEWSFTQGSQGTLVDSTDRFTRREQYNAVGLEFTPADPSGEWSAFIYLWDNDPTSPTYYDGDFGKHPIFFTEEYDHLPTIVEAERVARRKLYENSGLTRSVEVQSVYNPLLLPNDKIEVELANDVGGFDTETHFIESIDLPLHTGGMGVVTRLSRLPGSFGATANDNPISGFNQGDITVTGGDATGAVVP